MNTLMERIRNRRLADRRARVMADAVRSTPSGAVRRELLEMASRHE